MFSLFLPEQNGHHLRYFQMHVYEWKIVHLDSSFTQFFPKYPINNKPNFGSHKGLAVNKRKAIVSNKADPVHRRLYTAPRGDEFCRNDLG